MNRIFRLLWNRAAHAWVVVAEIARSKGKKAGCSLLLVASTHAWAGPLAPPPVEQLPTGAVVVAGQAAVSQSGGHMKIQQTSDRAAIDWATFNVGSQASVHFQQPSSSSVVLNRVLDSQGSQIWGKLTSNGQVFLSNPNGVYFSPTSSVSVGGLVATTHSMSNLDFMAGSNTWSRNGATGAVVNDGELKAALGGYVALLAPEVRNRGIVIAQAGTVGMAAGETLELQFEGSGSLAKIRVSPAELKTLVENSRAVLAPGGLIVLSAQAANQLAGSVVRNTGLLEASGVSQQGGRIFLDGGEHGQVSVSGQVQANAPIGRGGSIEVLGQHIRINGDALLSASGATGGGEVRVGGSWQSQDTNVRPSTTTTIESGALLAANATGQGSGGTVVVLSDIHNPQSVTQVGGTLQARGADDAGQGGRVETSGYRVKIDEGLHVDTRAPSGHNGTWLIDPNNYTIAAAGGDITGAALSANLGTGNVSINTLTQGTLGSGDILVNDAVTWAGANLLTLSAERNIAINADISASGNGAGIQLFYGGSNTTTAPAPGTGYKLGAGANITLSGTAPVVWIGNSLYTPLKTLASFSAMNNSNGKFVLVNDIDASVNGIKNGGWVGQLGSGVGSAAVFDGFGNTISNMTISSTYAYQGLIGYNFGTVRNVGIQNFTLLSPGSDQSLGLIGLNTKGSVSGITVSGTTSIACSSQCGTIIGWNDGGNLSNFNLSGTIALSGTSTGGAVGRNTTNAGVTGTVSSGTSSADITSVKPGYFSLGGMVGSNSGDVSDVSNSGTITVTGARVGSVDTRFGTGIGGLIGENGSGTGAGQTAGLLTNSSFSGAVTVGSGTSLSNGFWGVGGLVGYNHTSIQGSTSSGTVSAGDFAQYVGGLAGNSSNVYANSAVTSISNSISTGNVSTELGAQFVGGIAGSTPNYSALTAVTSRGTVSTGNGSTYVGGLTGFLGATGTSLTNSASSSVVSVGGVGPIGNYGVASTYRGLLIGRNIGTPSSVFAQNAITVSNVPLTVNFGTAPVYSYALLSGSLAGADTLQGILSGSADCAACTNVGVYTVTVGTLSANSNYYLTWQNGSLTVNPVSLRAITGGLTGSLRKTYDGNTSIMLGPTNYVLTGFVGSDNATVTQTLGNFNNTSAGAGKTITVNLSNADYAAVGTTNLSNYILPTTITSSTGAIDLAALTVSTKAASKTYDGIAFGGGNGVVYSGFVGGESSAVLGGMLSYGGTSQGAKDAGSYSLLAQGLTATNYNLTYVPAELTVGKAALTVSTKAASKTYDGIA
ncbi:MAG: filamentous hemagglutinin N-terminal domain-containing protein, partial [Betaproteobacteria bacterium]